MYPKWPQKEKKQDLFQHHFRSIIFGLHVNVFATEAFAKNYQVSTWEWGMSKRQAWCQKTWGVLWLGVCWQVDFLFTESDVFVGDQRKRTKLQQNLAKHQSG